jgi:geranylgeranyl diphosphate synthase type I
MRAGIQPTDARAATLTGMLHYHLGWADENLQPSSGPTGKRIRSALCLLSCEASGGTWSRALPAAAALELLHNFSLIHDDIEDGDPVRRGRPTLWAVWGIPQAINAGDALYALAHLTLLRITQKGVSDSTARTAARLFSETCLRVTEGQHLDIGFEGRQQVSIDEYLAMIAGKTAALVASACELGALIGTDGLDVTGDASGIRNLRSYGYHLGMAFQMQDDILGIWGEPTATGKPAGSDLARRKKSLPILHGLGQSEALRDLLSQAELSDSDVGRATGLLDAVGSRAYVEALASSHHGQAISALQAAQGLSGPTTALRELADRLLGRDR